MRHFYGFWLACWRFFGEGDLCNSFFGRYHRSSASVSVVTTCMYRVNSLGWEIAVINLWIYRHRRTYILPGFFLFSTPNLRARWTELIKIGHMLGVTAIWKRMSKIWGIPSPYESGTQNHLFGPTSQLNGKFNGLYLPNETRYRQSVKCVDNYKGSPTSSQNVMNFGLQTASNWTAILPTLCKLYFSRNCQASQTEISKQNSTTFCQTAMVNRANNLL